MTLQPRPKLAPSLLSADFGNLAHDISAAEEGGADSLHLDIMDGHFVPNISFGPAVVKSVRARTSLPLDVHLMVSDPGRYLTAFAKAGGDVLVWHVESNGDFSSLLEETRKLKVKAGVAISPSTPFSRVVELLPKVDELIVMSVEPGFSGQKFIPGMLSRISEARELIDRSGRNITLSVDGGINDETVVMAAEAGADFFVCGNSVYGNGKTPQENLQALRAALQRRSAPSPKHT
jgi:ribulose-phosphate 3-epimerase